jgi:6-pyruvoyltetrahydropterin/6-carboxytetrahydropterin synthase
MFEVSVCDWFSAAHQIRLPDGTVEPLHGHNWRVEVTFCGERLDADDLLVDFVVVQRRLKEVLSSLHDTNLNESPPLAGRNPTAEAVAAWIGGRMRTALPDGVRVSCVSVEEAPGCIARYRPTPYNADGIRPSAG